MDEPRSVIIHQSLHRPEMALGAEREPALLTTLICLVLIVSAIGYKHWLIALLEIIIYIFAIFLLRKMAKSDPIMTKVWNKRMMYQEYYPARTSVWSNKGIYK